MSQRLLILLAALVALPTSACCGPRYVHDADALADAPVASSTPDTASHGLTSSDS